MIREVNRASQSNGCTHYASTSDERETSTVVRESSRPPWEGTRSFESSMARGGLFAGYISPRPSVAGISAIASDQSILSTATQRQRDPSTSYPVTVVSMVVSLTSRRSRTNNVSP